MGVEIKNPCPTCGCAQAEGTEVAHAAYHAQGNKFANDTQIGGDHYRLPIQPWDFIVANGIGFLEGNAIKYICRHRKTLTGREDLEKAIHYLQKAIESYYAT